MGTRRDRKPSEEICMKEWVRSKLDLIDQWFPPERLARSRERIRRLWAGEAALDRQPFTYAPVSIDYYDKADCFETRLRVLLDEILFHGPLNDDFVPHLFPGCRQSTLPSLFGAKEIILNGDCTCERILSESADLSSVPDPQIAPGSVADRWLQMQRYFVAETDGRLPVSVTDMQGPMDACGQIWSYDQLFLSAYENPELCHGILDRLADGFILLWQTQKQQLGDLFVGTHLQGYNWVPPEFGASLSADSLVMVSPEFYNQFYRPPIEKIGKALGQLSIHSCGNPSQNIPAVCATPYIRGINAAQMTVSHMVEARVDPQTVLIAYCEVAQAADVDALRRRHGLHLDLAVGGMPWPKAGDKLIPAEQWTLAQQESLHRAQEMLTADLSCS
jgi:hypothetical protein